MPPELFLLRGIWCLLGASGFPDSSVGKESACSAGDPGLIPGSGRSVGEGIGYPLQSSGLENSMDCIVHGVTKSWTWLSNFHFDLEHQNGLLGESGDWEETELIYCFGKSNKSFLGPEKKVCKGKERGFWENGNLKGIIWTRWASLVVQLLKNLPSNVKNLLQCGRPGFDPWVRKIRWRRERLPTPVFWPGEFHRLYNPWGRKESDTTEWLSLHFGPDGNWECNNEGRGR